MYQVRTQERTTSIELIRDGTIIKCYVTVSLKLGEKNPTCQFLISERRLILVNRVNRHQSPAFSPPGA